MDDQELIAIVRRPVQPLRPGDLAAMHRRARQIRRHRLLVGGGVLAAVCFVIAGIHAVRFEDRHSLEPVRQPPHVPDGHVELFHDQYQVPPVGSAPDRRQNGDARAANSSRRVGSPADSTRAGTPLKGVTSNRSNEVDSTDFSMGTDYSKLGDGLLCDTSQTEWSSGPTGWCMKFTDAQNDHDRAHLTGTIDEWYLGVTICRLPGYGSGTIQTVRAPRLRIYQADADELVLDSSARWPSAKPSQESLIVQEGRCPLMAIRWDTRGNRRTLVPNGAYRYDFDLTDPSFMAWNDAHDGQRIEVVHGDAH